MCNVSRIQKRIMLEVAYDGTRYHGWQYQEGQDTIEGYLNRTLSSLFDEDITVIGASRTDAGVHAKGNIAVFDTCARIPAEKIPYALNRKLPEDIRIVSGKEVPLWFHPRKTDTIKTYKYRIVSSEFEYPTKRLYAHWTYHKLDVEKMNAAAKLFEGEHDFAAFCAAGSQAVTSVRTIYSANVFTEGDEIVVKITGNGFLYNMVRIIAGTLIEVGRGRMTNENVKNALESKDRAMAGPTAPANGLTLEGYEFPILKYGLIGEKLGHSFSVEIHEGMGNNEYSLKELAREEVENFFKEKSFSGINVTIPYKETVMKYCDEIDPVAAEIGSVNTVVNRDGKLYAYNTDYLGMHYMARQCGIDMNGRKVMILGTGGTAKTAVYTAKSSGAGSITIVTRNVEKLSEDNKNHFSKYGEIITYEEAAKRSDIEVLINTTPVGMYPKSTDVSFDISGFASLEGVIDVIYNPLRTELLLQAKQRGLKYTCGLPMLVAQAWYAEKYFMGREYEGLEYEIKEHVKKITAKFENLVLVGMPGSGKSTLARLIAKKTGAVVFDTDKVFTDKYGCNPGKYISENGEAAFRQLEEDVVIETLNNKGAIISTGGGSILSEKSRNAMMRSGRVIYLKRNLNKLSTEGRPLSTSPNALENLYNVRKTLYESIADYICDIDEGDEKKTAKKLFDYLEGEL